MQIPASSVVLFAAASVAIIFGRFLRIRLQPTSCLVLSAIVVVFAGLMSIESIVPVEHKFDADIRAVFINDPLANCEQWLVLAFGIMAGIALLGAPGQDSAPLETYGFLLFGVAALVLVAHANDFLELALSFEVLRYALAGMRQLPEIRPNDIFNDDDQESQQTAGTWFSTGAMWVGIALLSFGTSTTNFDVMRTVLADSYDSGSEMTSIGAPSKLILLGAGLVVISLFARLGLIPFQSGFDDDFDDRTLALNSLPRMMLQLAGSMILTRLLGTTFIGLESSMLILVLAICLINFVATCVLAVRAQSPGVRSIPYCLLILSILQSAWFGVGLMVITHELQHPGLRFGIFQAQSESLALCVFLQVTMLLATAGIRWTLAYLARADRASSYFEDFKGLIQFAPVPSITLMASMACAVGVPLTAGFWARWLTLLAGSSVHWKSANVYTPHAGLRLAIIVGTVATICVAVVVVRLAREMFLESPLARPTYIGGHGPLVASVIISIAILVLGIAPQVVLEPLRVIPPPREVKPDQVPTGSGNMPFGFIQGERGMSIPSERRSQRVEPSIGDSRQITLRYVTFFLLTTFS